MEKNNNPTRPLKEGTQKNSQIKPASQRPRESVPSPPPAKPNSGDKKK